MSIGTKDDKGPRTSMVLASPRADPTIALNSGTLEATFDVACSNSRPLMTVERTSPAVAPRIRREGIVMVASSCILTEQVCREVGFAELSEIALQYHLVQAVIEIASQ